ncbi:MAG: AAA family ATPase [Oceanospirillaceae bacterium]
MQNAERNITQYSIDVDQVLAAISQVLLGKQTQIKLALSCIFAGGHLLIEDLPGMGKTTLAHAIADVLGLSYKRVQFTSDLLPADLLGISIFNQEKSNFEFHQGPIFTQLLLADEINRSSAKTQSALLEAMEEKQVSIEGVTRKLPDPFFVIATQNPTSHSGTYPLPESQLDRFMMRITLGFPAKDAERIMLQALAGSHRRTNANRAKLEPLLSLQQLEQLHSKACEVQVSDHLLDYVQRLMQFTRQDSSLAQGVSPRGSLALVRAAKAWAMLEKRSYLIPEDIQQVFTSVIGHRLSSVTSSKNANNLANHVLSQVDVVYT